MAWRATAKQIRITMFEVNTKRGEKTLNTRGNTFHVEKQKENPSNKRK